MLGKPGRHSRRRCLCYRPARLAAEMLLLSCAIVKKFKSHECAQDSTVQVLVLRAFLCMGL